MRGVMRPMLALGAVVALAASVLGPLSGAAQGEMPRETPRETPQVMKGAPAPDPKYDVVLGLIIRKASAGVAPQSLARAAATAGVPIARTRSLTRDISVLTYAEPMTFAESAPLEAALEARPDVIAVEPDRIVYPVADPVLPNDPRFDDQWDMWNGGGSNDYSVRAPLLWGTTTGSSDVVVGVIDTGSTNHPDLAGSTVPGFDFISDAATARDGNKWDSDPADEGDWCPEEGTASSWHGTHVAGTVNAVQDNGIGISGLAPGVKVQHLRALGECGGLGSDILAAVIWGSGGDLGGWFDPSPGQDPGQNPTPAQVLNMSLGGEGECDAQVSQVILNEARARGTTVVVAAGNEGSPVGNFWPASCSNIVTVAASNINGALAGFSNYGTSAGQIDITAPGADILSTLNNGTTVPTTSSYAYYDGTSMATPHVAAAAALLYSLGVSSPAAIESALKSAARPFPAGSGCNATKCGAGLLDVSTFGSDVPAGEPGPPTAVMAVAGDGEATISWTAPQQTGGSAITSYTATASPGGLACTTSGTSCVITGLTNETTYTASVRATNAGGATGPAGTSASFTPSADGELVPGAPTGVFAIPLNPTDIRVQWDPPLDTGSTPIIEYLVQYKVNSSSWTDFDEPEQSTQMTATGATSGNYYQFRVAAVNSVGTGPWSAPSAPVTTDDAPRKPGRVAGVKVSYSYGSNSASAQIRWNIPASQGSEPVDRYRVRIKSNGGAYSSWTTVLKRVAYASKLRQGRQYTVQIQAHNAVGWGPSRSVTLSP